MSSLICAKIRKQRQENGTQAGELYKIFNTRKCIPTHIQKLCSRDNSVTLRPMQKFANQLLSIVWTVFRLWFIMGSNILSIVTYRSNISLLFLKQVRQALMEITSHPSYTKVFDEKFLAQNITDGFFRNPYIRCLVRPFFQSHVVHLLDYFRCGSFFRRSSRGLSWILLGRFNHTHFKSWNEFWFALNLLLLRIL